jgi:short-subunit dehydrogenase
VPQVSKHVLVTGASSGIGAAVAARFAAQGAVLTLLGRDRTRLARVGQAARDSAGSSARVFAVDFAHPAPLARAIARIAAQLPRLDALVHAAGVFVGGSVLEAEQRSFQSMLQVNAHAALAISRALVPLLEASRGTIVFINTAGVQRPPLPITARYIAAKHLLLGYSEALREELNPRGIRVTCIYPARTATPMQETLQTLEGRRYRPDGLLQPEDVAELIAAAVNLAPGAQVVDLIVRPMPPVAPTPAGSRSGARRRV